MLARRPALAVAVALSVALGGCGGAHTSPAPALPSASTGSGTASFTVVVPPTGSGSATPQSIAIALAQVNGAAPTPNAAPFTMNLSATTPTCTSLAGGALSCIATVSAPLGSDTFTLTTYAGLNQSGTLIATTQAKASITGVGKTACVRVSGSTQPAPSI